MCIYISCINTQSCYHRDAAGRIIKPAPFQSRFTSGTVARVEPNRRWFGEYVWLRALGQPVRQASALTLERGRVTADSTSTFD